MIKVVSPMGGVMRVAVDVPNMRDVLFFEVSVDALTDANQTVFVPTRKPQ